MKFKIAIVVCLILSMCLSAGCRKNPDDQMHGAVAGAGLGAITGLALGALVGEPGMGAATGAIAGGASGVWYEYDSNRQDRRNRELAAAITAGQQGNQQAVQQTAPQGETVAQSGTRHLEDFLGEWNISAWVMRGDGTKLTGSGKAKVVMESREIARFTFIDIVAEGVTQDIDGGAVLGYSERNGFTLECTSTAYEGTRKYVGEYIPQNNEYNFYPVDAASNTGTTGIVRSNIKLVVRASANMLSINTFSMIEGEEVNIQSYRFTK